MADFTCDGNAKALEFKAGRKVLETPTDPRTHNTYDGGEVMPVAHDIDYSVDDFKTCKKCEQRRPIDRFTRGAAYKDGRKSVCNECRSFDNFMRGNPTQEEIDRYKERRIHRRSRTAPMTPRWKALKTKYGVLKSDYERMEKEQGGRCAICLTENPGGRFDVLVVDHCHDTGTVRGLLCSRCNSAIGVLGDTPEALARAFLHVSKVADSSTFKAIGELAAELVRKAGAQ